MAISPAAMAQLPLAPRLPTSAPLPTAPRTPVCVELGVLDVRAGAAAPGNGSPAAPFPTLAAAFEHARATSACRLVVRVAEGSYAGDVEVTRPTDILGASRAAVFVRGGVVNRTASPLTIRRVTFRSTLRPAVLVETSATTTIEDVAILRSTHFGIRQNGGRLVVANARIDATTAGRGERVEGTAIYLTGDTQADLADVSLADNTSGALHARGAGVRVIARRLSIRDTGRNPSFAPSGHPVTIQGSVGVSVPLPTRGTGLGTAAPAPAVRALPQVEIRIDGGLWGFGAVAISDGAAFFAEDLRIERSEMYGLIAHRGARVNLRRATIRVTRRSPVDGHHSVAGDDLSILDQSRIEMSDVELALAERAGLWAAGSPHTLTRVRVHHNEIGYLIEPPYDEARACLSDVRVHDNAIDYDSTEVVLTRPEPPDSEGTTPRPPPAPCATVPWP